ncbi:hypothetical protein VZT92_009175 [Zoarces viviparus]|uniref:Uncharacterized protein n=1 Tax=Zoarces viviparus TaxID=48416 RepID=A0AAW1FIY2_ZOAVI
MVEMGGCCSEGLDRRTGQPVSPSCQGQSFLPPPDSAPNICPELARRPVVPKPQEPANEGPRQTDPRDTRTNAARRTARRNASHVPQRECKTSCAQQHPSVAHIWAADVTVRREACCTVLHARLDAGVHESTVCMHIYTAQPLFFFDIAAANTCVYVYNRMGRGRSNGFCGWKERRSEA